MQGGTEEHLGQLGERGGVGARGGSIGKSFYCGFHGKEWTGEAGLELAGLNHFGGLWEGAVPGYLVPGLGMTGREAQGSCKSRSGR